MNRTPLLAVGSGVLLALAAIIVLGYHDAAARTTLMWPVLIVAAAGVPAVLYSWSNVQKLAEVEREVESQEKLISDTNAAVDELRNTIERQLAAIEETAASLHH